VNVYYGGIEYYLMKRNELQQQEFSSEKSLFQDKFARKNQKRIDAEIRQQKFNLTKDLKKELELCEKEINTLEEFKIKLETELADPVVYSNPSTAKDKNIEYDKIKELLEEEYNRWTELSNKLEGIEQTFK
jgi:uncharacterized protein YpuA (DUF1002 family)